MPLDLDDPRYGHELDKWIERQPEEDDVEPPEDPDWDAMNDADLDDDL